MSFRTLCSAVLCTAAAAAIFHIPASAQASVKPGLYENTVTMKMNMAGTEHAMPPRTSQACVTQEQVDKYHGAPPSGGGPGDCSISNLQVLPDGAKATISCTGQMAMTGDFESHYSGDTGHIVAHMKGNFGGGGDMEMTSEITSTYKGADCGNVKPYTPKQ